MQILDANIGGTDRSGPFDPLLFAMSWLVVSPVLGGLQAKLAQKLKILK